jgi:hypothetical protein
VSERHEYKVLGKGGVEAHDSTGSRSVSLHYAIDSEHMGGGCKPREVEQILNALAAEGWELVTLAFPYVFRRAAT